MGDTSPRKHFNQIAMPRFSDYTTYRQYQKANQFWLEVTVAEIFTSSHVFDTAEDLEANREECCRAHEADLVPPAWLRPAIQLEAD